MVTGENHMNGREEIEWGRRVPKRKIRRLYESDAGGLLEEELLDDVGTLLLQRCKSILIVADAQKGSVHCPRCERQGQVSLIERPRSRGDPRDQLLVCPRCRWQTTWGEYQKSFKRHQLNPGGATASFSAYVQSFAAARTPQAKMLAIDRLIHEFHYSFAGLPDQPTRPVGVNLIEGNLSDVIDFLNELTSGAALAVPNDWQIKLAEFRQANDRIREHIRRSKIKNREKSVLREAIDTSMFLLPELPGRVEWLRIPGVRGRVIDGSDPFVSLVGAARLTPAKVDQTIQEIHSRFTAQHKAYGWIVSPLSEPSDLGERIVRLGHENVLELAGMVNTHLDVPIRANPAVTVRQVTKDDLEVAIPLLAAALGFTPEGARATVEALALSQEPTRRRAYLAFLKDNPDPVAYASMIHLPDQPVVVLYCAATLEAYRGQGVYTSLVARRLEDAYRDGARAAVIQAVRTTSAPICQKLGFVEQFSMDWYIWEPETAIQV